MIVKRGEHGASLHTEDRLFYCPAFPLQRIFDTTGAGDTFLGGLVGWVARKGTPDFEMIKEGILIGSALASFTVESFGVKSLDAVGPQEINSRLDALRGLTELARIAL